MSEKIEYSLNVQVFGGPRIFKSNVLEVDAYDKFEVVVPTDGTVNVTVQPGEASNVQFVLIDSNNYDNLTCVIDPTASGSTEVGGPQFRMYYPLMLVGQGAVSLLGSKQKEFRFVNEADYDASVVILIGRKAT